MKMKEVAATWLVVAWRLSVSSQVRRAPAVAPRFSRPQSRSRLHWSVICRKAPNLSSCPSSRRADGPFDTSPHWRCGIGHRRRKGPKARSIDWHGELPVDLPRACWTLCGVVPYEANLRPSGGFMSMLSHTLSCGLVWVAPLSLRSQSALDSLQYLDKGQAF